LTSDNLLLNLDQRAAGTECREEDIGDEIALDVVLLAGFVALEELKTMGHGYFLHQNEVRDENLHISNTAAWEDQALGAGQSRV
jgi:hypothetical protein